MSLFFKNIIAKSLGGGGVGFFRKAKQNQQVIRKLTFYFTLENADGNTGYKGSINTDSNNPVGSNTYDLIIDPAFEKIPEKYTSMDKFGKSINFIKEGNNNNSATVVVDIYYGPGKMKITTDRHYATK